MSITSAKTGATGISLALENNYMEPIASTLVGSSGVNNVTFSDIPQGYKHLQIRYIARSTRSVAFGTSMFSYFNSDTTISNYYNAHILYGDGTTAGGAASNTGATYGLLAGYALGANATANCFTAGVIDILDYSNANKNKTVRGLSGGEQNSGNTNSEIDFYSGLWMKTDPISSIALYLPSSTNFTQHSRFSLYGIKG
jgi:hypothetical protein